MTTLLRQRIVDEISRGSSGAGSRPQEELQALCAICKAQQRELDALRTLLQQQPRRRRSILDLPTPMPQAKVLRPMDYWVNHVPDYGDTLTQAELAAHLNKPRVRPEDITLSAEDLARQRRRSPAAPRWDRQTSFLITNGASSWSSELKRIEAKEQ